MGAVTAGFLYSLLTLEPIDLWHLPVNFPLTTAVISGFLSCFLALKMFFIAIENKNWLYAFLYGPWFCGLAGAVAGGITGISIILSGAGLHESLVMGIVVEGYGLWVGFLAGAVAGFIFGPPLTILLGSECQR